MKVKVGSNIASLVPYQPGKPVEELQREMGLSHIVKLASNENPFGPSPMAVDAIRQAAAEVHFYPDGDAFLLKARLSRHLNVPGDRLLLSNGSNEAIHLIVRTFYEPGCHAVVGAHAFVMYKLVCIAAGMDYTEVPSPGLCFDLAGMAAAIRPETRFVFLINPNNPTGTYFSRTAFEAFMEKVPAEVFVVLDEAYFEFVGRDDYPDGTTYIDRYPNLMVLRTFSKCYGLAGLRMGYSIMSPELAGYVNRLRDPFNVNLVAQKAAVAALDDVEFLRKVITHTQAEREAMATGVRALGLEAMDSVGNFILMRLPRSGQEVFQALLREGVIVRPMGGYGLPDYIRVSVGLRDENATFLAALARVMAAF